MVLREMLEGPEVLQKLTSGPSLNLSTVRARELAVVSPPFEASINREQNFTLS
jgi:hypothetical protein